MSAAAAPAADSAPPKGKKKLLIIIIAAVLLLVLAGGGAMVLMKKKAADAEAAADDGGGDDAPVAKKEHKEEKHEPPTFVPLDNFTVNLADHDADRFAQIGITLQVVNAHAGEEVKTYLPAIRNNILMVLAHKTAAELLTPEGKEKLAAEIRREACRPLGVEIELDDADHGDQASDDEKPKKKKKKKKKVEEEAPVTAVNFSSFIIQ